MERLATPVSAAVPKRQPVGRWVWVAVLAAVLAVLIVGNLGRLRDRLAGAPSLPRIDSIAVLPQAAQEILAELFDMRARQHVPALAFARIYMGLGDNDQAFEWLGKAYQERDWLSELNVMPVWETLSARIPAFRTSYAA